MKLRISWSSPASSLALDVREPLAARLPSDGDREGGADGACAPFLTGLESGTGINALPGRGSVVEVLEPEVEVEAFATASDPAPPAAGRRGSLVFPACGLVLEVGEADDA